MSDEKDTLAKGVDVQNVYRTVIHKNKDGSEVVEQINEAVAKMGNEIKPDVPTGLAVIPHGANVHALARRTAGEVLQNELSFHCMSCGQDKTLQFDDDEMAALDNNIRDYTGPCWNCQCMTLVPKDAFFGHDFPSMTDLAHKQKRKDARVQAEEFVEVLKENVGGMITGAAAAAKPETMDGSAPSTPDRSDLPEEADPTKLTPR